LTLYLDTSIFVPLTVFEQKTHAVQTWFSEQNPADLFFSEWGTTEFSAAIALKLRTGQIDSEVRAGANVLFSRYIQQYFQVLLVKRSDFRRAGELASDENLKLRAGDSLHLAIAEQAQATLCTLDKTLHAAALKVGIPAFTL
jgi:predicted nucleic acid-binding protein